jgi:hypothetical protein
MGEYYENVFSLELYRDRSVGELWLLKNRAFRKRSRRANPGLNCVLPG